MSLLFSRSIGLLALVALMGCTATEGPTRDSPTPSSGDGDTRASAVLATDGCRRTDERAALERTDPSDTFVLARVTPRLGCLGGKWILGETLETSPRDVFVGASSASECNLWDDAPPKATFAVVRRRQTAGVFHLNDPCFGDDGGRPLSTDQAIQGLALYGSEAEARAALAEATKR